MEERIKQLARQAGFDLCGITTADPFDNLLGLLEQRYRSGIYSEFEILDFAKRIDPRLSYPEANSIIALGKAYPYLGPNKPVRGQGRIARFAKGRDYHLEFREGMEKLSCLLKTQLGLTPLTSTVDTGPLIDRAVAARAGIGWQGKNCAIISIPFGSWIALGQILIKESLKPDRPQEDRCGSCNKCLKACPTKALSAPYQVNSGICLSALTQTKSIIPKKYRTLLGTRIYGCDCCQEVCPYNKLKDVKLGRQDDEPLDLISILRLSNTEFKKKYAEKAFAWRGKKIIQRNAIIALGNLKDENATEDLIRLLNGPTVMLRGYSAWALGRIASAKALAALKAALQKEEDPWVKEEIEAALREK